VRSAGVRDESVEEKPTESVDGEPGHSYLHGERKDRSSVIDTLVSVDRERVRNRR
jgi:hypothetical protein